MQDTTVSDAPCARDSGASTQHKAVAITADRIDGRAARPLISRWTSVTGRPLRGSNSVAGAGYYSPADTP